MGFPSAQAMTFSATRVAMRTRVEMVADPMWGTRTQLGKLKKNFGVTRVQEGARSPVTLPRQRIVHRERLRGHDVQTGRPDRAACKSVAEVGLVHDACDAKKVE
jgi:hypothetical protein